jgi:hypothetical protein
MTDNFNVDEILNKNRLDTQNYINKMVAFNKQLTFSDAKADSLIADDLLEMVNKHRYLHGENIRDLFITCINQIKKQYLIADTPNKVREISNSQVTFMASEATIINNGGYSAISIIT